MPIRGFAQPEKPKSLRGMGLVVAFLAGSSSGSSEIVLPNRVRTLGFSHSIYLNSNRLEELY
jgi:hypothetical protein